MSIRRPASRPSRRAGFTLVEILVALFILTAATVLIFGSYHQITRVKKKGEAMLDKLRQADWVVDQLTVALRSAVFLDNNPKKCAFWLEDNGEDGDVISWVTSSAAFMPPNSQLAYGLHRVFLSIEDDDKGRPALHASGYAYLADNDADTFEQPDPWLISRRITGLNCRVYDDFKKEWADEYEKEDAVPAFVEITLTVAADDPNGQPQLVRRTVQVPAGTFARNRRRMGNNANASETQEAGAGSTNGAATGSPNNGTGGASLVTPGGGGGGGGGGGRR